MPSSPKSIMAGRDEEVPHPTTLHDHTTTTQRPSPTFPPSSKPPYPHEAVLRESGLVGGAARSLLAADRQKQLGLVLANLPSTDHEASDRSSGPSRDVFLTIFHKIQVLNERPRLEANIVELSHMNALFTLCGSNQGRGSGAFALDTVSVRKLVDEIWDDLGQKTFWKNVGTGLLILTRGVVHQYTPVWIRSGGMEQTADESS